MIRSKPLSPLHVLLVLVALLALPAAALAQTTGGIVGTVTAADGSALPGVTVEATSPALQGSRVGITDADGAYTLAFLPPGAYHVKFTLESFHTQEADLAVSLGRNATVNAVLQPSVTTEAITVVASAPLIDTIDHDAGLQPRRQGDRDHPHGAQLRRRRAGGARRLHRRQPRQQGPVHDHRLRLERRRERLLHRRRQHHRRRVRLPGQGAQLRVHPGARRQDRRLRGRVRPLHRRHHQRHHQVGRQRAARRRLRLLRRRLVAGGGRRGRLHRRHRRRLHPQGLRPRPRRLLRQGQALVLRRLRPGQEHHRQHAARRPARRRRSSTSTSDRDLAAGKLTWRLNASHSLIGTFFQDPRDDAGAINDAQHSLNGDPLTYEGVRSFGGEDYSLRYEGLFGGNWLATAQASRHQEENSVGPETGGRRRHPVPLRRRRLLPDRRLRSHPAEGVPARLLGRLADPLSSAATRSRAASSTRRRTPPCCAATRAASRSTSSAPTPRDVYSHFYWTTPTATVANAPVSALVAAPEHQVTTVYLQDRWNVTDSLTLSLGVRWDRQEIIDASGTKQIDLDKDYAPRLGFIWAPPSDTHQRLYGSYGRYYEQLSMDLVIRSFSYERQARIFNFSPTGTAPNADAEADLEEESVIFGGFTEPSDPDLENQYINEYILGYDREVAPDARGGDQGHLPRLRPGDRGLPLLRPARRHLLHRQPRRGDHARDLHPRLRERLPGARAEARLQGRAARRQQALLEQLAGHGVVPLLQARRQLRRPLRAVHQRRRRPQHLRRLRLLRLLHRRRPGAPRHHHQQRTAVERPPPPVQGRRASTRRRGSSRSAPPPTGARARRSPATATPTSTAATSSS